ncbi:MAG: patatin-like phospholipase family protein [Burkholderiales bacterium]|nr:MAG: patatin-like phospholipase family protein [Burkholderiales bacterium]
MRRPRVALVIGSGGLRCAAALGLWRVLAREAIPVDLVVGCSGGAIYGALIGLGWSPADAERYNRRLWTGMFARYDWRSIARALLARWRAFDHDFGIVDDSRINQALAELFGDKRFEDCRIPTFVVATDFLSGEKVVLSEGRLREAVRASIAIPIALRPWTIDGRVLHDGGMCDPLPVDVAVRERGDIIVAMGFRQALAKAIRSPLDLVMQTSDITTAHLLHGTYAFYNLAHHAEVIPVLPEFDRAIGLGDVHLIDAIVAEGERATERELPYLKRLLEQSAAG